MPRTITVTLPAGYEDATHLIVVGTNGESQPWAVVPKPPTQRSAHVLRVVEDRTEEVEEIGVGPLGDILPAAARVIRGDWQQNR